MARPTKTQLFHWSFIFKGKPFCNVPGKDSINTNQLDFLYEGKPFWAGGSNDSVLPKIFHGNTPVTRLYVGTIQVGKAYLGTQIIF